MLGAIAQYISIHGTFKLKLNELKLYLAATLPNGWVPCIATLARILKTHFSLQYKKTDKSKLKYKDPTYNAKRLWVSKLLTQFHFDGALIISVDESCFRT